MNNKTHIPEIISKNRSLLMGVAILMVIMYHAFCCNLPMGPVSHILRYGYLGVDIFIFLSAIGLCYSFEKNSIRRFYTNRIIRILPLFLCLVVFRYVYDCLFGGCNLSYIDFFSMASTLSFWGIGNGVFVDWYLSTIIWLYLIFPIFYSLIKKIGMVVVIVLSLFCISLLIYTDLRWEYVCAVGRLPIFVAGIYLHQKGFNSCSVKYIILMFGIMLIMNALSGRDGSIYWTAPFMISALLFIVSRNPYRFAWLEFIGRYTLELYVANCITMTLTSLVGSSHLMWGFYIVANIIIAYCLHLINRLVGSVKCKFI